MPRGEPEHVKPKAAADMDDKWEVFPLEESQSNSPKCWFPSQVKKVDERTPPEMHRIDIKNCHSVNINCVLPDGARPRTASDDRPDGNSRRRTKNKGYTRHSATGRYEREEHSPSRSRQSSHSEDYRRDRSHSRNRSLSRGRRSYNTCAKENDPTKNSFRK